MQLCNHVLASTGKKIFRALWHELCGSSAGGGGGGGKMLDHHDFFTIWPTFCCHGQMVNNC